MNIHPLHKQFNSFQVIGISLFLLFIVGITQTILVGLYIGRYCINHHIILDHCNIWVTCSFILSLSLTTIISILLFSLLSPKINDLFFMISKDLLTVIIFLILISYFIYFLLIKFLIIIF